MIEFKASQSSKYTASLMLCILKCAAATAMTFVKNLGEVLGQKLKLGTDKPSLLCKTLDTFCDLDGLRCENMHLLGRQTKPNLLSLLESELSS